MATFKKSFYTTCYIAAIILLLAFAFTNYQKMHNWSGCLLAMVFICLAIAFRRSKMFKGYWYSVVILAVATVAMYFPKYFKTFGGRGASFFIPIQLQAIMFGMGIELSLKDFAQVMRIPKGVIVGIVCHYTIMPLVGFAVAHLFNFPGEIAAGIILIGCCPSGLASNVMCYLAKANLALSVSFTAVSILLAQFLTPLLFKLLGGGYVAIDLWSMVWDITKIVIILIAGGLAFHYILRGKLKWPDKAMPVISMVGIACYYCSRTGLFIKNRWAIDCSYFYSQHGWLFSRLLVGPSVKVSGK